MPILLIVLDFVFRDYRNYPFAADLTSETIVT